MYKILILFLLTTLTFACNKKNEHHSVAPFEKIEMELNTGDVQVPSLLWEKLEQAYTEFGNEFGTRMESKSIPKKFFAFTVKLIEKTKGAMDGKNYEISFAKGGGVLDLANYIVPGRATFLVKFELDASPEKYRVFYVSNSRPRKIDNQIFGSGCGRFYEITRYFRSEMLKEGFRVNTTNNRYSSVLVGTYIFARREGDTLYISQLTIKDSKHPNLECSTPVYE